MIDLDYLYKNNIGLKFDIVDDLVRFDNKLHLNTKYYTSQSFSDKTILRVFKNYKTYCIESQAFNINGIELMESTIEYDYSDFDRYAYNNGTPVTIPEGWELIGVGDAIPKVHRVLVKDMIDGKLTWVQPRRCHSTMTPIYARVWGNEIAYAKESN